jgi:outer membrane protein insertion porin family
LVTDWLQGFDIFKRTDSSYTWLRKRSIPGDQSASRAPITDESICPRRSNIPRQSTPTSPWHRLRRCPSAAAVQRALNSGGHDVAALSYTLSYSTLDDRTLPREGVSAYLTQEYAGFGADSEYMKTTAKANYFHMLSESADLIGQVSVGAGHITGVGSGNLRIFDHLFVRAEDDSRLRDPRYRSAGFPGRDQCWCGRRHNLFQRHA